MAKRSVKVSTPGWPAMREALEQARLTIGKAADKALRDALTPPPPGMVRVALSCTVTEALLKDETAFGAYLVRLAKRNLQRG